MTKTPTGLRNASAKILASVTLLAAVTVGCHTTPEATTPAACPRVVEYPCLTERVCPENYADGCAVCRCAPPPYIPPTVDRP